MVVFKTLMMILIMLVVVNIILTFFLWRSTRYKLLKILFFHWSLLLFSFVIQSLFMSIPIALKALIIIVPNFLVHFSLTWVFSSMVRFRLPLKRFLIIHILAFILMLGLNATDLAEPFVVLPLVFAQAFIYFYASFKAFSKHYKEMTYTLRIIGVVVTLYGFYIFTYSFFLQDPTKFGIGIGVALGIHMAIGILLPAAILEVMTLENSRLKAEMKYKAQLTHASRLAALGEMAAGVAHEINNPLTTLSLSLELLKKSIHKEEYKLVPSLIERSQSTAQRVGLVVKGLLSFSRQEQPVFKRVTARELIDEAMLFCSEKIKVNNIKMEITLPENDVTFIGEKTLLTQVLLNIINNAFDAAIEQKEKWIRLEVIDLKNDVSFSITDSGKILKQEVKDRVFEPFFTTKDIGKGTGLGMSISKGIIETHKGAIAVDWSGNTRVHFTIPKS